jgi:hypothetical protein
MAVQPRERTLGGTERKCYFVLSQPSMSKVIQEYQIEGWLNKEATMQERLFQASGYTYITRIFITCLTKGDEVLWGAPIGEGACSCG